MIIGVKWLAAFLFTGLYMRCHRYLFCCFFSNKKMITTIVAIAAGKCIQAAGRTLVVPVYKYERSRTAAKDTWLHAANI